MTNETPARMDNTRSRNRTRIEARSFNEAHKKYPSEQDIMLVVKVGDRMVNSTSSYSMEFFLRIAISWLDDYGPVLITTTRR